MSRPSGRATRAAVAGAAAVLALLAGSPSGAAKKREPARAAERETVGRSRYLMGTSLVSRADAARADHAHRALDAAMAAVEAIESALDASGPGGELHAVNAGPAQTRTELSSELGGALAVALALARETGGAYDPTLGPAIRAWDPAARAPDPAALADATSRVGWSRAVLGPGARTVWLQREGMALTLDGIARGYALDRALEPMRRFGIPRGLFEFGRVALAWSDAAAFAVTVPHPDDPSRPAVGLTLKNGAAATAGPSAWPPRSDEQPAVFDPRGCRPVEGRGSVTVVSRSAARADGLARALLVLGREGAERWAVEHPDDGVVWLEPDGPGVTGWRWNCTAARAAPGAEVDWRN